MDSTSNLINTGIKKLQCCVAVQGVGAASRFEGKGYEAAHGLAGLGNIQYTQYIIHNTQYTIHNRIHNRVHNTQKSIDKLLDTGYEAGHTIEVNPTIPGEKYKINIKKGE